MQSSPIKSGHKNAPAGEVGGDQNHKPCGLGPTVWVLFWVRWEDTEGIEWGKDIIWLIFLDDHSGGLEPGKPPRDECSAVQIEKDNFEVRSGKVTDRIWWWATLEKRGVNI